jgi:transposase
MANSAKAFQIGVDVSKHELVISVEGQTPFALENAIKPIKAWLKSLPANCQIAMEATNDFHMVLTEQAHVLGHRVYLLNGYRLNRYREGIGGRAKTDSADALLIVRYLQREADELRQWEPAAPGYRELQMLLHRRATVVRARTQIQQSLEGMSLLGNALKRLMKEIDKVDRQIARLIQTTLQQAQWEGDWQRCQQVEGIGPITAAALTMAFKRGPFKDSDAFVAFIGMDVRVRDSGQKQGKRKLTKQGDPELRRLLYLAAMQAKRQPAWEGFYQRYIERGMAKVQALTILARKLARVAFALLRNQSEYDPLRRLQTQTLMPC